MKKYFLIITFLLLTFSSLPIVAQDKKERMPIEEQETPLPELSIVDNVLYVKNGPIGAKIEIMTIVGSKVKEFKVRSTSDSYELSLPRAIYIIKLEGTVRKFVIR